MRLLSSATAAAIDPSTLSPFDAVTVSLFACLVLLSAVSFGLVLHLGLRSRPRTHLSAFTPLLPLRFALTLLVFAWVIQETLVPKLALYLVEAGGLTYPAFCKARIVVSLGFLEPGFLITILFLVQLSIKKVPVRGAFWSILTSLLPALALQIVSVVVFSPPPFQSHLPSIFQYKSSARVSDNAHTCAYPLFSTIAFVVFAVAYCFGFLFTYWRVTGLVINKGTRVRIHVLACTLFTCIPLQVLLLVASSHWGPEHAAHNFISVGMFAVVAGCAAVGEGILVVKPIMDALSAGGVIRGGPRMVEEGGR